MRGRQEHILSVHITALHLEVVFGLRYLSIYIDGQCRLFSESIDDSMWFHISIVGGTMCYDNGALKRKKLKLGNRCLV
jgi:hypothetical protein